MENEQLVGAVEILKKSRGIDIRRSQRHPDTVEVLDGEKVFYLVNPNEAADDGDLYGIAFSAGIRILVWADDMDSAIETAAEWCVEHAPGVFIEFDEDAIEAKAVEIAASGVPETDAQSEAEDYLHEDCIDTSSGFIRNEDVVFEFDCDDTTAGDAIIGACRAYGAILNAL